MLSAVLLSSTLFAGGAQPELTLHRDRAGSKLFFGSAELRQTPAPVQNLRLIDVPSSPTKIALWTEGAAQGAKPFYAIMLDGKTPARVTETSYDILMRAGQFDPLSPAGRQFESQLPEQPGRTRIVQFHTQPLEEYRQAIREQGGEIYYYLGNHAYLVRLPEAGASGIESLPYVRWVGQYKADYRLDEELKPGLRQQSLPTQRYNIQVFESGVMQKQNVASVVQALGGTVDQLEPDGYTLQATLSPRQLEQVLKVDDVFFVDRWSPFELDMDIARQIGGGNYVENVGNYRGQGVRVSIRDGGVRTTHVDYAGRLTVRSNTTSTGHGTPVTGIVIGNGTGQWAGRGMMPEAHGIFIAGLATTGTTRYNETTAVIASPHFAVLETASGGSALTTQYTTDSFTMDDILFRNNILILNSQSNTGNQNSRPQAWSKNVVSVGGVKHKNTLTKTDDDWTSGASIGPAADGRIKPDLTHFYDSVWSPASGSDTAYGNFSGTSSATPITAGHFGLLFQMWSDGIHGQTVTGNTVFENRPSHSTMRALMYNNASPYPFSSPTADLSRVKQGWGLPDLQNVWDRRRRTFVSDEEFPLQNLQSKTFRLFVPVGEPTFRATMVYLDPPGTTNSTRHRINDLTLKVTAPNGTVYYGNNGLLNGLWSTAGGAPNVIDTTENVFVQNPQSGVWTVEVSADEVNQDAYLATPGVVDAAFSLVVSGVEHSALANGIVVNVGNSIGGTVANLERSNNSYMTFTPTISQRAPSLSITIDGQAPTTSLTQLRFRLESASNQAGTTALVYLHNYATGQNDLVATQPIGTADGVVEVTAPGNPSDYVQTGTRNVRAVVEFGFSNLRNWQYRIDQARWFLSP
jgi:hypothetical protein